MTKIRSNSITLRDGGLAELQNDGEAQPGQSSAKWIVQDGSSIKSREGSLSEDHANHRFNRNVAKFMLE
jgi:hypothetical protein